MFRTLDRICRYVVHQSLRANVKVEEGIFHETQINNNNNNNHHLYYLEFRACELRIFAICVFLRPKVFVRVVNLLKVFLGFEH